MSDSAGEPRASPTKVLVIEDSEPERRRLRQVLSKQGYRVLEAGSGAAGLEMAWADQPDVVLLGVELADLGGLEVCRRLKAHRETAHLPVVFMGGQHLDEERRIQALETGGNDFISEPCSPAELAARVAVMVRIKKAEDALRERAVTDDLTHLYNRRFLFERFEEEFSRARRYGHRIGCLIADVDHFKEVNDTHGHLAGDQVLREVAAVLQQYARKEDVVGRYGGEEFLLVLPMTGLSGARALAERLRKAVEEAQFRYEGAVIRTTLSIGIACYPECDAGCPDDLVKVADDALLAAKKRGRNQLVVGSPCGEGEQGKSV